MYFNEGEEKKGSKVKISLTTWATHVHGHSFEYKVNSGHPLKLSRVSKI